MDGMPLIKEQFSPESESRWRDELSQRVANFRRRRAKLRGGFDPNSTREFDFEDIQTQGTDKAPAGGLDQNSQAGGELDFVFGRRTSPEQGRATLDSVPLRRSPRSETERGGSRGSASMEASEWPPPFEIIVESSPPSEAAGESGASDLTVAPLGRRFLAGVVDSLMLLLAAGLFAAVFWWAGGRIHLRPINLLILAFIAGFFILSYFGLFSGLSFSTPGQFSMGIAVRSLDGASPTVQQCLRRAFGYLVSSAALMLGFIWALLDSDGLTWHDRMSGTFLSRRGGG